MLKLAFAEVEQEGKTKRYSYQQSRGQNNPTALWRKLARLLSGKPQQDHGGNDHIHREKDADPVREEILQEKSYVEAVFRKPCKERGVRRGKASNAQQQVDRFGFHRDFPFFADS